MAAFTLGIDSDFLVCKSNVVQLKYLFIGFYDSKEEEKLCGSKPSESIVFHAMIDR